MQSAPKFIITKENGNAVTPQEVYDAFISGPIILVRTTDTLNEETYVTSIEWYGTSTNAIEGIIVNAIGSKTGTINIKISNVSGG